MLIRVPDIVNIAVWQGSETIKENQIFLGKGWEYHVWLDTMKPFIFNTNIIIRVRCVGLQSYEEKVYIKELPRRLNLHLDYVMPITNEKVATLRLLFAGVIE